MPAMPPLLAKLKDSQELLVWFEVQLELLERRRGKEQKGRVQFHSEWCCVEQGKAEVSTLTTVVLISLSSAVSGSVTPHTHCPCQVLTKFFSRTVTSLTSV